ncbi:MAG: DUF6851 domain-containing protein [Pseudomonadota bacterium]
MTESVMGDAPLGVSLEEECAIFAEIAEGLPTEGVQEGTNGDDDFLEAGGVGLVDLKQGDDTVSVELDTGTIDGGPGADEITLNANVGTIRLGGGDDELLGEGLVGSALTGGGDDTVDLFGSIKSLNTGSGNDNVTITGNAHDVKLGSGDNTLVVEGLAGTIRSGAGEDDVTVQHGAENVKLGGGDDTLRVGDIVGFANGGSGEDTIVFDFNAGDFDIKVRANSISFFDRLTGEEMRTRSFENFEFNDRSFTLAEIQADFGNDALPFIQVGGGTQVVTVNDTDPGVSVIWDRVVQQAVIETDTPVGPTIASRAYAMMHTAMYDAWSAFDDTAVRVAFDEDGNNGALEGGLTDLGDAAKTKAMSFAALTVLRNLFPDVEDLYVKVMEERFGLDPDDTDSPEAALGIDAANDMLALRGGDGSNQDGGYSGAFVPTNPDSLTVNDITAWTPESVPIDPEGGGSIQSFLTPQWQDVESFAIDEDDFGNTDFASIRPVAPQPFFTDAFSDATLNFDDKTITLGSDATIGDVAFLAGDVIDVSQDLIGEVINEGFITQAEEVIEFSADLDDTGKIIAEFWEDGGGTAFPPGTWMTFGQFVSSRDGNSLDQDAQLFFALGNAVMDAGIATWEAKVFYDYARPVRAIRDLGELGLIGEEGVDANTGETGFVIEAFGGFNEDGTGRGTQTILAENFITFQRPGADPSPPFAEYTSGHSAFSAAGAEVLALFTGSDEFGGAVEFAADTIQFEAGVPSEEVTLAWDTFSFAADEAGLSRLFGGIHFNEGDVNGRTLGRDVGEAAFELAQKFINGEATDEDRPFFEGELLVG